MSDVTLDPIWRQAAKDAAAAFTYGDTIPHEWIAEHLEIKYPDGPMSVSEHRARDFDVLRKNDRFREELLTKYQYYLVNIRGYGYKVIAPQAQTSEAMGRLQRDLRRSLSKAMSALVHVNYTVLSLEEARENAESKAKLAAFSTMHVKALQQDQE